MRVSIKWDNAAWAQFEQLPAHAQQAVREIAASFAQNPYGTKHAAYTISRGGRTVWVHTRAGTEVLVDYFRGGLFGRKITVTIVGVAAFRRPTMDEIEEQERNPRR